MANIKYEIWQMPIEAKGVFMGLKHQHTPPSRENYKKVYESELTGNPDVEDERYLDILFGTLNVLHPADYKARSLSVSDVVVLRGVAYFCEPFGWKKLETF